MEYGHSESIAEALWPSALAEVEAVAAIRLGILQDPNHAAFLRRLTVPAGSYPGQDVPISSVGSWSFVMARPTLPDDIAYRLARALHRGEAAVGSRLSQARETTMANKVAAAPRLDLIHPGVLRYLREIGLMR